MMDFLPTSLTDAYIVRSVANEDERGYFIRARCAEEFGQNGLPSEFVQTNLSFNAVAGTFRGLHFQVPPSSEGKLVRCVAGAVDDVIVDLRPDSQTFLRHEWFRLSGEDLSALFVPSGFAHGFVTAADSTLVLYEMSDYYAPELGRGVRWNNPSLDLQLPQEINAINQRDMAYSDLQVEDLECFRR